MNTNNSSQSSNNIGQFSHPKYRADIDGLRAVAVLSVVAYHAFPIWGKGGLIGVDIFFVISGFLISTIIFENLEHNRFSFIEFYCRRIRRIFPALLLVLVVCFVIGWFALLADEYAQLGKHIAGGSAFISNFLFLNESGYFDKAADTKPLLHLWSLGIEEQFYIVWPLLLWGAWKKRFNMLTITVFIASVSFVLNIQTIEKDGVAAFYLPQTRFWELVLGSVLAYVTLYKKECLSLFLQRLDAALGTIVFVDRQENNGKTLSNTCSLLGAALIVISLLVINKESTFPGWLALLPTVGTVLLISASPLAWFNRKILANPRLVWFGLISYPLYLWHWPLLSFARIIQSQHPARDIRVAAVLLSIVLAWLTYRLVERPLRFGKYGRFKAGCLFAALSIVGISGYTCYLQVGLQFRRVVQINVSPMSGKDGGFSRDNLAGGCGIPNNKYIAYCDQDSRQTPRFALLGDSKAAALFAGLFRTSKPDGRWVVIGGNGPHGSPAPILSDNKIYKRYQKTANIGINAITGQNNIEAVALVMATRVLFDLKNDVSIEDLPASKNYNTALDGLSKAVDKLLKAGKKIVLVVDNPTFPDPKDCMDRETSSLFLNKILLGQPNDNCQIEIQRHLELSKQYRVLLRNIAAINPKRIKIFDTIEYLCETEAGVCRSNKDGHSLYSYSDHISDYAAGVIGKGLNEFILDFSK